MASEAWFVHMGLKIKTLDRVAFTFFHIDVYWYGMIIGLGLICGLLFALREAKRTGQEQDLYLDYAFIAIIASIIGARVYYVIFSWDYYQQNPLKIFAIREGGLAIYGGVLTAIACAWIYCKVKRIRFFLFADTAILGLIIGQAIGRWGNFVNREAFGGYTDSLLALRYVKDQVVSIPASVLDKQILVDGVSYIQVHPTFLYESLWNIGLFVALNAYKGRKKFEGEIFFLYLLGYGFGRFFIERLRTDQLLIGHTDIPVSCLLSAILVVTAIFCIAYKRYNCRVQS